MLNQKKIISELNKVGKHYFPESSFYLTKANDSFRKYISKGNFATKAINNIRNSKEEINVVKWFDDFWISIEILFNLPDKKTFNTFFTLSVFQGESTDDIKNQLFRAEWDTYDNNKEHPQPHWHFHSNRKIENIVNDFIDLVNEEDIGFASSLNEEKSKGINIEKIHFAMQAQWGQNKGHIHKIGEEATIINWFQGLLGHIKTQLEDVQ